MSAISINLSVNQGSDYDATFTITNENGAPLNLNGYIAEAKLRKTHTSSESQSFTIEFLDRVAGVIKISLTNQQTSLLKAYRYVYDIVITSPNGTKTRVIEGLIEVSPGVT